MVRGYCPFFTGPVAAGRLFPALSPFFILRKLMRLSSVFNSWRALGVGLLLAIGSQPAAAQLLPSAKAQTYDFLTVTTIEASTKKMAKLLFAPAFNGRTEVQLETIGALSTASLLEQLRRNNELLTQNLSELSAAGWELIQVSPTPLTADKDVATTRYLLRKAKN
jgi:hypothetical protein